MTDVIAFPMQPMDFFKIGLNQPQTNSRKMNPKKGDFHKGRNIFDLILEQAEAHPDFTAVVFEDHVLNYSELTHASEDVGALLQELGASPNECIGLFMDPSLDLIVGAWGILAAGSAYLPLSPEYPEDRLKYMIEDSRTRIVVTQEHLRQKLAKLVSENTHILTLKNILNFKSFGKIKLQRPTAGISPNDLAYVIYTSGSTGKPKGVMIEHHSIVNQMLWLKNAFDINDKTVILQKTPMSFDAAQWEILAPSCGSKIIMGSPGIYRNPEQLVKTLIDYNVTDLQCVPTLLQALLDIEEFKNCLKLTQIFSGGEALSKQLANECIRALPHCKLINLYGPTECTINSSAFVFDPNSDVGNASTVSIGRPINNTSYYILNENLSPLGIGEIGELYIGGEGVARGYLHQPELTAEKFLNNPFRTQTNHTKLYKSGDLAYWNADQTVQYAGRADNQVKLRGYRVELDEINSAIQDHDWVKNSAVILKDDLLTGFQNLIAFIELNPKEAALMDQGNHDSHHQSKESKAQILMQLSNKGCREQEELDVRCIVNLPGRIANESQIQKVFARKSYRFFEGNEVRQKDLLDLLSNDFNTRQSIPLEKLTYENFGEILRYFGQFKSDERLLPKYGYASPGALYATQMYLELNGVGNLQPGYYYYHSILHQLILVHEKIQSDETEIKLHFVGKRSAIEPIYKNNILEVLEMETGHMIGLFEKVLSDYGFTIQHCDYDVSVKSKLKVAEDDFYLGTFQFVSIREKTLDQLLDVYVQSHPGKIIDLPQGLYKYNKGSLEKVSDEIIQRKHVIAINQQVYERSSFGITLISKTELEWMTFINLGIKLQILQMNDLGLGMMSSGYSSKSGNDLPSAKRIREILGHPIGHSYFFIGGCVSNEQMLSQGMKEDNVHMKGPSEMIKDDLVNFLPDYMIPNKVVVLNKIPLTVNGKINLAELKKMNHDSVERKYIAPRSETEHKICEIWKTKLKKEVISIDDNFFELGGNSLIAVSIIVTINKVLKSSLSLQALFESPSIVKLASKVGVQSVENHCRLIPLKQEGCDRPIYCWPGLGGYCMNLRILAKKINSDRPFFGVQAYGINKNEIPYLSLQEMAAKDINMIRKKHGLGPITLWGYSFGSKVAFETAYQLEQLGVIVESLVLIAPGMPKVRGPSVLKQCGNANFNNKAYVSILFSVFMGGLIDTKLEKCIQVSKDEESFVRYITTLRDELEPELVIRIINIVSTTFELNYLSSELRERKIKAPITVLKAKGDYDCFLESSDFLSPIQIIELASDHYSILKDSHIDELISYINPKIINEINESEVELELQGEITMT